MSRLHPEADPDDIIFSTPEGKPIGDRMFRERIWQPTCKRAGVRTLHVTPSLLPHVIETMGWTLPQSARIADSIWTL